MRIAYGDQVIIDGLDWTIDEGEHCNWWGPNGAGKVDLLLSLITGRSPARGYNNELHLFGRRRAAARASGRSSATSGS